MPAHINKSIADKERSNSFQKEAFSSGTSEFVDNRPEAQLQNEFQQMANNSPQVVQAKGLQGNMSGDPIQMKRISVKQMQNMGFTGPHAGNTWQWNASGGIHVTVRRENGIATHFHVRKDSKGGVYNRINYNENDSGDWVESDVNVPAGAELEAEMKVIAAETIQLIKALVPPKD